jgi:hypothetical protein
LRAARQQQTGLASLQLLLHRLSETRGGPCQERDALAQLLRRRTQRARGQVEALLTALERQLQDPLQPLTQALQLLEAFLALATDQPGCCRRGRCARGRHEVADGEVGLVADAADHRQPAGSDRPSQPLVVERVEVFDRSAAANQQDQVAFAAAVGRSSARTSSGAAAIEVAARLVQADPREDFDPIAVARVEADHPGRAAEHHRPHACCRILQGEVPLSACGTRQVRDLAADPELGKTRLQDLRDRPVELTNGQDFPHRAAIGSRLASKIGAFQTKPIHKAHHRLNLSVTA